MARHQLASARTRARTLLGRLSPLVVRRSVILATALGAVVAGAIVLAVASVAAGLIVLAVGMIMASAMQAHREQRLVLAELRNPSWRRGHPELAAGGPDEVLDRLKLTALSLGRISQELAAASSRQQQLVTDESARLAGRMEALQNLHAMVRVTGQLPPLPARDCSPRLVLQLVEQLRTGRPALLVGCGAGAATVWAALAARQFGSGTRIVVLEHDPATAAEITAVLAGHDAADRVEIRTAPLEPVEVAGRSWRCYQRSSWTDLDRIDLLYVDERCAAASSGGLPALAPLAGRLVTGGAILLEDPARWGAGDDLELWSGSGSWVRDGGPESARDGVTLLRRQPASTDPGTAAAPAPPDAGPVDHDDQVAAGLARAARSVGWHDAAWVLAYHPVARTNPYQALLYSRAPAAGFAPVGMPELADLPLLGSRAPAGVQAAVHLHLTSHVIGEAEDAGMAKARVESFVGQLRELQDRGVRVIWTVHNRLPHRCGHPEVEIGLRQELADLADVVHIMTPEAVAEVGDLYRLPADRLLLAPHPSYVGAYPMHHDRELVRLELGFEPTDFVAGLIGSIQPYKGVDDLIEVVTGSEPLPAQLRTVVAGVPGRDPESARLVERLARTAAIRSIPRKLDDQNLARLVTALDVMVLPYRAPLTSGAAMLALSFGVPLVAPGVGPFRPLAEQGYCLSYDRDDPSGLAQALRDAPGWAAGVDREAIRTDLAALSGAAVSERFFADLRKALPGRAAG